MQWKCHILYSIILFGILIGGVMPLRVSAEMPISTVTGCKEYDYSCSLPNGSNVIFTNVKQCDLGTSILSKIGNDAKCAQTEKFTGISANCICKSSVTQNMPKTDCETLSTYLINTNKISEQCSWKAPEGLKPGEEGGKKIEWKPLTPNLAINIPTLKPFTTEGLETPDEEGNVYIPYIGQYAAGVYKYLLLIAGIIAAVRILAAGFNYTTAGGNSQKLEEAKSGIAHAIIGLVLVLGSYLLLYTINPDLVRFKSLKIQVIQSLKLSDPEDASSDFPANGNPTHLCKTIDSCKPYCQDKSKWNSLTAQGIISESQTVEIKTIDAIGIAKSGARVTSNLVEPLKKAGLAADKAGYKLYVSSGFRTLSRQLALACPSILEGKKSKFVSWPGGSNHGSGRAVDIYLQTKDGKTLSAPPKAATQNKTEYQQYNKKLAEIMYGAGWKRLKIEVWHFEYPNSPLESSRTASCFETSC